MKSWTRGVAITRVSRRMYCASAKPRFRIPAKAAHHKLFSAQNKKPGSWKNCEARPPRRFEPVGVAFVTGSISAPGTVEAFEHKISKKDPLRPLFLGQGPEDKTPQPTINMLVKHGVRSCLEYAKTGDIGKARQL